MDLSFSRLVEMERQWLKARMKSTPMSLPLSPLLVDKSRHFSESSRQGSRTGGSVTLADNKPFWKPIWYW